MQKTISVHFSINEVSVECYNSHRLWFTMDNILILKKILLYFHLQQLFIQTNQYIWPSDCKVKSALLSSISTMYFAGNLWESIFVEGFLGGKKNCYSTLLHKVKLLQLKCSKGYSWRYFDDFFLRFIRKGPLQMLHPFHTEIYQANF